MAVLPLTLGLAMTGCGTADDAVSVQDAWSRPMPVVSNVAAIYATIENNTAQIVHVVGASSPRCAEMRVHETNLDDGVMTMNDVADSGLAIEAGDSVVLEPNGLHLMCLGTDEPFVEGDVVAVTLQLGSDETIEGSISVEQR